MIPSRIQILPFLNNPIPESLQPLVFSRQIIAGREETNVFLLVEARDAKETEELGKELWFAADNFLKESASKNIVLNPELACEDILRIFNQALFHWSEKFPVESWNDFNILFGVANHQSFYFSRIGEPRVVLFRRNEMIMADENLSEASPKESASPFSEVTGGALIPVDRFIILSRSVVQSLNFEELSALTKLNDVTGNYLNVVRSLEVSENQMNTAFILAEVSDSPRETKMPMEIFEGKIREYQIGNSLFKDFNPFFISQGITGEPTSSFLPWQKIALTLGEKIVWMLRLAVRIVVAPFNLLSSRTSNLSFFRRSLLFLGLVFFVIFLGSIGYFFLNRPEPQKPKGDYQAIFDQANKLMQDSENSLIYKDEDKARRELQEADSLLEQVSSSGDLGIKAVKMRKDLQEKLSVLDKAEGPSNFSLVWSAPGDKGALQHLASPGTGSEILISGQKTIWEKDLKDEKSEVKEVFSRDDFPQDQSCLLPTKTATLLVYPQIKFFYEIGNDLSVKKQFNANDEVSPVCGHFENFLYFANIPHKQIEQYAYGTSGIDFRRNWINQALDEELKDDEIVSLAVDGSIFVATQKGKILKLSGGKKANSDFEKPANPFGGKKVVLRTDATQKNLYILDPERQRIIIFEKESGKLKSQIQDKTLDQIIDFFVLEDKKEIYLISDKALFKMGMEI